MLVRVLALASLAAVGGAAADVSCMECLLVGSVMLPQPNASATLTDAKLDQVMAKLCSLLKRLGIICDKAAQKALATKISEHISKGKTLFEACQQLQCKLDVPLNHTKKHGKDKNVKRSHPMKIRMVVPAGANASTQTNAATAAPKETSSTMAPKAPGQQNLTNAPLPSGPKSSPPPAKTAPTGFASTLGTRATGQSQKPEPSPRAQSPSTAKGGPNSMSTANPSTPTTPTTSSTPATPSTHSTTQLGGAAKEPSTTRATLSRESVPAAGPKMATQKRT